jgi:hypothetical protein
MKRFKSKRLKMGTVVRSHYAAKWTGVVEEEASHSKGTWIVRCRITLDRRGNPLRRKSFLSIWLLTVFLEVVKVPGDLE